MNVADLMKPRYKCIADYPSNPFYVNEVIDKTTNPLVAFFDKYPHLFRKLAWYEERDVKDMPEYVKIATANFSELRPNGTIHKVTYWDMNDGANLDGYWYDFTEVLPSSQHDYETFKNGTK